MKRLSPGLSKSEVHWYFYVPVRERERGGERNRESARSRARKRKGTGKEKGKGKERERTKKHVILFLNHPGHKMKNPINIEKSSIVLYIVNSPQG